MSYTPLLYILLGIIIARLFWRPLLTIAAWGLALLLCATLWRAAPMMGLSSGWLLSSYGAGFVGFLVGALIALKPIINMLVESDYRRAVDRARGDADRRRV